MNQMKLRKLKQISGYLLSLSLALITNSCNNAKQGEVNADQFRNEIHPADVDTISVVIKELQYSLFARGQIKSGFEQKILAETEGVVELSVLAGTPLQKGDQVAKILTGDLNLRLERAKIALFNAQLEYTNLLLGHNSRSNFFSDSVKQRFRLSSGLAIAELDLKEIEAEQQKALVRSPASGLISDIKVSNGQLVRKGDELFTVHSRSELFLETHVLESEFTSLVIGQKAEITPFAARKKYVAVISEINPKIDSDGTIMVKLKINRPVGLLPGMNAVALITIPKHKSFVLPKEALVSRGGQMIVFTVNQGVAEWNYVVTGLDNGKEIEIVEGLREGQIAIISNNLQLTHNSPVNVIKKR